MRFHISAQTAICAVTLSIGSFIFSQSMAAEIYSGEMTLKDMRQGAGTYRVQGSCNPPTNWVLEVDGSKITYKKEKDIFSGEIKSDGSFIITGSKLLKGSGFVSISEKLEGKIEGTTATGTFTSGSSVICVFSFSANRS